METRRLLLFIALSVGILLLWGQLFPAKKSPAPAPPPAAELPTPATVAAAGTPATGAEPPPPAVAAEPIGAASEERVSLVGPSGVAVFTNRGAQLVSFKTHERATGGEASLELVRSRAGGPFPFGLTRGAGAAHPLNDALFVVAENGEGALTFRYRGEVGQAEKRFSFDAKGMLVAEITASQPYAVFFGPGIGNPGPEELKSTYHQRAVVYAGPDGVERLDSKSGKVRPPVAGTGLGWVALDDNYFLSAVLPRVSLAEVRLPAFTTETRAEGGESTLRRVPAEGELPAEQKGLPFDYGLELVPATERFEAATYWGGKQYDTLAALPGGLQRTVNLGFFGWLARPLMIGLEWLYDNVVENYGWAIVLMTVLIKVLLLPLTHKSMVSMGKLQELNPRIQAIRSKYAGRMRDKQGRPNLEAQRQMNDEVMGLYRSEGVNPAGGCLPMVLQLPVFFAFFKILSVSYDLRQAPWLLWVQDLSTRDPYFVLPIVMGATQFAQTWMMPSAGNDLQRKMMLILPIVFTFLFAGAPSGLVLYWLTNNVLSIAQQWFYNRLKVAREGGSTAAKTTKPAKKKAKPA